MFGPHKPKGCRALAVATAPPRTSSSRRSRATAAPVSSASTGSKLRVLGTTVDTHPGNGVGAFDGTTVLIQCTFVPFPTCAAGSVNTIKNSPTGVNVGTGRTGTIQGANVTL